MEPMRSLGEEPISQLSDFLPTVYERVSDRRIPAFFREHESVFVLLEDAAPQIEKYFGLGIRVELEVVFDPEDLAGDPTLYAVIKTQLPPKQAIDALRQFDDNWWLEASYGLDAPLCVTI